MSIEAMKRIKSLLQDGDKIDSHTISAVVAECDAAILTQQPDNAACKSVQKRLEAQQPAAPEPVAWLYVEDGEVMFGHPNGYRPADARPLVFGDTHQAPSVPDDVRHIVGWWLCNEANPQDGSPWTTEPSQRVLDHMKVVSGEKHTVMRLVAIDAAMLADK